MLDRKHSHEREGILLFERLAPLAMIFPVAEENPENSILLDIFPVNRILLPCRTNPKRAGKEFIMADVSKILKDEITRISKKEVKSVIAKIQKENVALKKTVIELQRRIAQLEKEESRLAKQQGSTPTKKDDSPENAGDDEVDKARITASMIKAMRKRLGLSQTQLAKLLGVNGQTIYQWEKKQGRLSFRGDAKAKIVAAKKMKKADVAKLLQEQPEQK